LVESAEDLGEHHGECPMEPAKRLLDRLGVVGDRRGDPRMCEL
jgi:hypothetical protein